MHFISTAVVNVRQIRFFKVSQQGQSPAWAAPQLGCCAPRGAPDSSGWLGAPKAEAGPPGAQPRPWVLELAASKAAHFTAFAHVL